MDEQLALIARLKVALGRASDRQVAEEVLRSLQNRDDLYQVSAREIESLLAPLSRQVSAPQRQDPPKRAGGKAQESTPRTVPAEAERRANEADEREAHEQTATRVPAQPARGTAPVNSSESMDLLGLADKPPVRAWRAQIHIEKESGGHKTVVLISLTHEVHTLVARWASKDYVKIDGHTIKESYWSVNGTHDFVMTDGSRILTAQITLKENRFLAIANRYNVSRLVVDGKEISLTYS